MSKCTAILIGLFFGFSLHCAQGQDGSVPLSAVEAYKLALAPFTLTRSQANDLTDADQYALRIGIARASHDCLALSADNSAFSGNAEELYGMGQLCIFGRQYEPARAALVNYLALQRTPQREQALVLLARAFLGLGSPGSAEAQVSSLLRDYPYDASIHASIDQVLDSTEGIANADLEPMTLKLCEKQTAATLPVLAKGKGLEDANGGMSAAALYADAIRCATVAGSSNKPDALEELAAILQEPHWAGTADLVAMQASLKRQQMVGKSVPISTLRGSLLGANSLVSRTVSLKRETVLLVPFTVWSPDTPDIARYLANLAPRQTIYAITSWRANTGRDDVRSKDVLETLHSWKKLLPPKVSILIVPDSVLTDFHSDIFPAGISIRDGIVLSNAVLSSRGAVRMMLKPLVPVQ